MNDKQPHVHQKTYSKRAMFKNTVVFGMETEQNKSHCHGVESLNLELWTAIMESCSVVDPGRAQPSLEVRGMVSQVIGRNEKSRLS